MHGLGRYRVLKPLGTGAAGGVYLVEDRLRAGPPLALKRIHARSDDLLRASFEREFTVLASLALPGVARVIDFGRIEPAEDDAGGPFFTRTYVEGEPLDVVAARGDAIAVIRQVISVCRIVQPLHRMGIAHGDLKPGNVIVDAEGRPHVIDFGLAGLPSEAEGRRGAGTLAFMAPELLRGEAPSVATDVCAMGATLWLLIAGAPPFAELGDRATAARLSGASPRVPDGLTEIESSALKIAARALEADPTRRTPAVEELAAALAHLVPNAEPVSIRGFVPPRPRGHGGVFAQLDVYTRERLAGRAGDQTTILIRAPRGGGKSTLLRELKWRLQVGGVRVVELASPRGTALGLLDDVIRRASVFADSDAADPASEPLEDGEGGAGAGRAEGQDDEAIVAAVTRALVAVAERGPTAVLFDDADASDVAVGRALRMALHAEGASKVAFVATADDALADSVVALGARHVVDVPSLDVSDVAGLVKNALGPVDISVARALHRHTAGIPGALIDALAALAPGVAPTAEDVASLPIGEAGDAAARARLRAAPEGALPLLSTLAASAVPLPRAILEDVTGADAAMIGACERAGLLSIDLGGVTLTHRAVADALLDDVTSEASSSRVAAVLSAEGSGALPVTVRATLALRSGDAERTVRWAPDAAARYAAMGATGAAIELLEALASLTKGARHRSVLIELSRLEHAVGRLDDAERAARRALEDGDASADERAAAAVAAARACTSAGRFDAAVALLSEAPTGASAARRSLALRELAKVHLRRGDYDAAEAAAEEGLFRAAADDPVRVELLTSAGMVSSYQGDHEAARGRYREALSLATARGSRRDEANVRTYLAIDHHRAGEHRQARDLYASSFDIARELGDVGSMATFALNLGAVSYELGEPARAAQHYELAARLARRAGRATTELGARINLAQLHVYLGMYEQAAIDADSVLVEAEEATVKPVAAQAVALLGDVAARTGDVDAALSRYDDAMGRYRALGQRREVAETLLDSAQALLDRNGPADTSAAVARLADARTIVEEEDLGEYRLRLRLLMALGRGETGDVDGAVTDLQGVMSDAREGGHGELEWQILAAAGRLNAVRGADFLARRQDQEAMEVLESIATRLPRDHREAFWHDPRRREVRRRAGADRAASAGRVGGGPAAGATFHSVGLEARAARLLELIKRLASEHDVDRLLQRIMDSAVELVGAERGFVLLVGEGGQLEPRTVQDAGIVEGDPHVAFSRSIAEAVLIDGEPIITVDARDDDRLSEYMSVHKLMLKSVACLPIHGRAGTLGVLYLEHRMRRGRFDDADVDLLFAFADQAAIALENARLIAENEGRRAELERANEDLAAAKAETERILVARTQELHATKRDLDTVRQELRGNYQRHGIVGTSEAMRRVFAVIDRVSDTSVSVVIQGESGTGKELVARAIHYAGSRAEHPFVAVNCAAIPEALIESELFGHVRGAFTGADRDRRGVVAQAAHGTLFLDEVGDMPGKMQVDLLRVLQDRTVRPVGGDRDEEVDVRIIAASNKQLSSMVEAGRFREDLFYRLNVVELRLPPLRDRVEDIPLLCDHFLASFSKRDGVPAKRITRGAMRRLAEHPLPGNVRQLEHVLLNAWVLLDGDCIDADDLALDGGFVATDRVSARDGGEALAGAVTRAPERASPRSLVDFQTDEKQRILEALEAHGWNRVRAAKALGIPRRTFYRRLKRYDIL